MTAAPEARTAFDPNNRAQLREWWQRVQDYAQSTIVLKGGSRLFVRNLYDHLVDKLDTYPAAMHVFLPLMVVSARGPGGRDLLEPNLFINDPAVRRLYRVDLIDSVAPITDEATAE